MRVLQVNLSNHGFRDPADNPHRLELLRELLEKYVPEHTVVVLPGGFLSYQQRGRLWEALDQLTEIARARRVTLVGGIDIVRRPGWSAEGETEHTTLPLYGFAAGLEEEFYGTKALLWQQTSTTSDDYKDAPLVPDWGRVLSVLEGEKKHRKILVLICGELYRQDIDHLYPQLPLVAVCGHEKMVETHGSLERVSSATGGLVVISQHFAGSGSLLHHAKNGHRNLPESEPTITLDDGDRWLRATLWTV
jgi:hypothetical protein